MIIQAVLTLGLLGCLVYSVLQERRSRFVRRAMFLVSLVGIYFVLAPEKATELARMVGVGRGADLVLYCWVVITLIVSLNLRLRIINLQALITELARDRALQLPRVPDRGGAGGDLK